MKNNICVQCGHTREEIKKKELCCCTIIYNESGSEVDTEWTRHRFKPYSKKELESMKKDEETMYKQMGEIVDFFKEQETN
ncbi:MAG: hypothetical protein WC438_06325 [Candidatus Pacearchaeota archaeon]